MTGLMMLIMWVKWWFVCFIDEFSTCNVAS